MAKQRRQRVQDDVELPDPFPHPPKSGGKYEIKIEKAGGIVRVVTWNAAYAAHIYLDAIIRKDKLKWLKRNRIGVLDMEIECNELEELLEHKLTPLEQAWEMPEPYVSEAAHFRGEKKLRGHTRKEAQAEEVPGVKSRSALTKRQAPPPREVPKGMITIATICEELKIEPRIARGILRKTDTPKPDEGWMWDKKGADSIKTLLKKETK